MCRTVRYKPGRMLDEAASLDLRQAHRGMQLGGGAQFESLPHSCEVNPSFLYSLCKAVSFKNMSRHGNAIDVTL